MDERCSKCILPANLPGIDLDAGGTCRYCRQSETKSALRDPASLERARKQFEAIAGRLKGKGKYDCLVPFSGGKESSYILWVLIKQYALRPLAFNFNNGFQHPDAVHNIESMADKLGVDLLVYRPDQRMLRELMKAFLSRAGEFCTPCNMLISATAFRFAKQNNIKAIMSGNAARTDPGISGLSSATYYDRRYYLNVAGGIVQGKDRDYYINPPYLRTTLRRLLGAEARVINVLDYLQPTLQEIHHGLDSIGWKRPAGAIQHGDCLLDPLKEYLYYRRWGCTEVTGLYSTMIRNGEITRDQALAEASAEEPTTPPTMLSAFLETIGMSAGDFDEAAKRDFRDIPNMRNTIAFRAAKKVLHTVREIKDRV